ncbi:MAG: response regulator transcription factor [Gammaproteobacteria bacterium]|nr:response regulator transcription factor [Gammaproteobacteria bacterium]MDE2346017.1 response regulator transcription factor [Gammaproteobacteria bacterium]
MKVLVVDDELPARVRLKTLLAEIPDCEVVGEAGNGREALQLWESKQPDVLLLDIRMPVMDGLETARHLAGLENPPAVVFTTAYDEFAVEAFKTRAIAYLLKPVRQAQLAAALDNAGRLNRVQISQLSDQVVQTARHHICARLRDKLQVVPVDTIQCFIADQKYVTVCHSQGELLIDEALKDLETEFSERFIRVHRNALVALTFVRSLEKSEDGRFLIHLQNHAEPVEVSRRMVAEVRARLRNAR